MSFICRILSTNGPAVTAKHEERVASASHTPSLSTPTAVVYLTYDIEHPPIHPGPSWTRFVCISDTHSHVFPIPPGDVLLHAGDLSSWGSLKHLQVTVDWLATLPHPIKM
ncbi:hypothetical protein AcW2_004892 [Taiwanofungus camphoratus]|nr:hypothetical protein AcW2_004892 [Antrodia cinnamomea]